MNGCWSALALAAGLSFGQAAWAEPVVFAPHVKAGDAFRLVLTKSRERQVPDKPVVKGGGETPVDVKVLAAAADGTVIEWVTGETKLLGATTEPDQNTQALLALGSGLRFEIALDAKGEFKELRNFEEVKQRLERVVDKVAERVPDEQRRGQVKQALRQTFSNRAAMEQAVLKEVMLYLYPLGKTLEQGKPLHLDTEMPTPLGGKLLPASVTLTLKSRDKRADSAKVEWKQQIDKKAANEAMRLWLEQMGSRMGRQLPKDQKIPEFDISDRADFVVSLSTGWTESLRYTRKIIAPGATETQSLTI